jgi:DNA-binding MarR family transcriptional regulator
LNRHSTGEFARAAGGSDVTAADVALIIQARRLRDRYFDPDLFADPAWSMLLDLYRAHLAQHRLCITSLCHGSGAPVSTAIRWLSALEQRGLTVRFRDPLDGRRYFIELTPEGIDAMARYFRSIKRSPV